MIIRTMKRRKRYERLSITRIILEVEAPVMVGSVIEQNTLIKAASQEVEEVDFSDTEHFDIEWE